VARILVALALLFPEAALASVTTHPVPLQTSECQAAPGDASSIAGHVLFEYVVETSGGVDRIKLLYADVRPPEKQPALVADLTACIRTFKFRPATVDGAPAATLMKAAFHRLPPTADPDQVLLPDGQTVSQALIRQMRAATLTFTEALLKGPDYKEAQGNGWRVRTDLPKSALDDVQGAIGFARRALDEALPGRSGSGATAETQDVTLILFKDQEKYRQLSAFDNLIPERAPTLGEYDPQFRLIYSAAGDRPILFFARVMAHEATHHFLEQRLQAAPAPLPRWLNEGMAQFIECLKPSKSGTVRLDALDRGNVEQMGALMGREGAQQGTFVWKKRVEAALADLRENLSEVDVAALVDGGLDRHFFDEHGESLYDVSWLLVHFLMNGEDGRHRDAFRAWVLDAGAAKSAATLAAATAIPAADLPARLREHLARLR
jgi:hypothetical protein